VKAVVLTASTMVYTVGAQPQSDSLNHMYSKPPLPSGRLMGVCWTRVFFSSGCGPGTIVQASWRMWLLATIWRPRRALAQLYSR
jgi:hypothetical protein